MGPMAAAGPYAPMQQRVNWLERLEQGFQVRHNQRFQNHNGGMPMAAGASAPTERRVNHQERLEQGFQARQAQRLQNRGGRRRRRNEGGDMESGAPLQEQNHGILVPPQQFMGQQERYAEEERQHAAHLHDIQLRNEAQRQIDYDQETLRHQAHLAEFQQQLQQQREIEHQTELQQWQMEAEQQQEEANCVQALRIIPKG